MPTDKAAFINGLFELMQDLAFGEGVSPGQYVAYELADAACNGVLADLSRERFMRLVEFAWRHAIHVRAALEANSATALAAPKRNSGN